jgi:hypothetical protein
MKRFLAATALSLGLSYSPAFAQALDGTWNGVTPRGLPLQVTISGNQTTSYYFRGYPQSISGGKVSGGKVSFDVAGNIPGKVVMTKGKGNTASFRYTDSSGPDAMVVTVTKQ